MMLRKMLQAITFLSLLMCLIPSNNMVHAGGGQSSAGGTSQSGNTFGGGGSFGGGGASRSF